MYFTIQMPKTWLALRIQPKKAMLQVSYERNFRLEPTLICKKLYCSQSTVGLKNLCLFSDLFLKYIFMSLPKHIIYKGLFSLQPLQEVCLFNISLDPCEFENVVFKYSSVVKALENTLRLYKATEVPRRNKPIDPR